MMTGVEITLTRSSTSLAIHSGRGCRDAGGVPSASCSARRQATKLSRRSDRRSEAGRFTSAATSRWMTSPGDSHIRGWINYYGRYYKSALYPTLRHIDRILARWAQRKFKSLRRHRRQTAHWIARVARRQPSLFAHWALLQGRGWTMGAG